VIITGKFRPELSLLPPGSFIPAQAANQLSIIGNADGMLNTAGRCMIEARAAAMAIAKDMK
jgi:hypothetical protein